MSSPLQRFLSANVFLFSPLKEQLSGSMHSRTDRFSTADFRRPTETDFGQNPLRTNPGNGLSIF